MKFFMITTLISSLNLSLHASETIKVKNKESVYNNLLSRFECVIGPNVNDPEWICNKIAPKGWGEFYGNKLKKEKNLRKLVVKN